MKRRLTRFARDQTGAVSILFFALLFALCVCAMMLMEIGGAYEKYDYVMDVLQRDVNSAVESSLRDEYRADRVLRLDTAAATAALQRYIDSDLTVHGRYTVRIDTVTATETPPSLTASGVATFPTLFSRYGFEDVTFEFKVMSKTYDLDG